MKRIETLTNILTEVLVVDASHVTGEVTAKELGADSLDAVELIMEFEDQFDIDITDEEGEALMKATVDGILALLDDWLGPEEPVDGLLTLTDDQFIRRYRPETNDEGGYFRQREWCVPADVADIKCAIDANQCWTAVDDDYGNFCIVWGNRTVNRIYNILTSRPIENPDWEVQVPDEDAAELNETEEA